MSQVTLHNLEIDLILFPWQNIYTQVLENWELIFIHVSPYAIPQAESKSILWLVQNKCELHTHGLQKSLLKL